MSACFDAYTCVRTVKMEINQIQWKWEQSNGMELSVGLLPLYDFNPIWFPNFQSHLFFRYLLFLPLLSLSKFVAVQNLRMWDEIFIFYGLFFWNITYKSKVVGVSMNVCLWHPYKKARSTKIFAFNLWFYLSNICVSIIQNSFCMLWIRLSMDLHKFPSKVWKWNVDSAVKSLFYSDRFLTHVDWVSYANVCRRSRAHRNFRDFRIYLHKLNIQITWRFKWMDITSERANV